MADAADGKPHFDVDHAPIEHLNGECVGRAGMDLEALERALRAQGEEWYGMVAERCPHLFAASPVFVTTAQLQQMQAVIAAVERVVALPGWHEGRCEARGVFYGYDFHLNEEGAHLIEINTNAGGGFVNALLIDSQREAELYGAEAAEANLERRFLDMFRNEWKLARGDAPLASVAIVDEQPDTQYLYPEFLLAQRMFGRAGIAAYIADPSAFEARGDGLYLGGQKIDLVYNRLTDFSLQQHPALRQAYRDGTVVVTPGPAHYERYADKRNLVRLSDADALRALGASEDDIATLLEGVPQTRLVSGEDAEHWWQERKHWFFKPATGYGSKGSYSGAKVTKRVFGEIMHDGYVAQRMAAPGERKVCLPGMEPQSLKYDVRCYVYDGRVQLVAARLYQGQTTNFRTPGGGFAPVRVVE
ncbi:MAG TPA: hypothetical protein VFP33_13865 [Gallionella sp.]|nr:hypothetical protein [Gallionella sp.]